MAYRRDVLKQVGGFDDRFALGPSSEDTDLALSVLEAGYSIPFESEAVVHHPVDGCDMRFFLRDGRFARLQALLIKKHPRYWQLYGRSEILSKHSWITLLLMAILVIGLSTDLIVFALCALIGSVVVNSMYVHRRSRGRLQPQRKRWRSFFGFILRLFGGSSTSSMDFICFATSNVL